LHAIFIQVGYNRREEAKMRTRKPTVSDIARHLDLSPSTVSRVLTGSQLVKEETRRRIEAAADELGYTRRRIRRHGARSILTIALFIPRSSDVYHRLFTTRRSWSRV
jgi:DNA-binding LacI/PurR family transcriptional regulator